MGRQLGDPLVGAGVPQLMGEAPVATPQLQARLAPEILQQSANLALQAILKFPDMRKMLKAFTSIWQGMDEPYMQFIDRLHHAVDKQVEHETAKEVLLLKLAIENANPHCKKILQTLRNPSITDMLEACNRVGSIDHQNESFARALAAAL